MVVLNYKFELSKTFDKYSNSASNPLLQNFYYSLIYFSICQKILHQQYGNEKFKNTSLDFQFYIKSFPDLNKSINLDKFSEK